MDAELTPPNFKKDAPRRSMERLVRLPSVERGCDGKDFLADWGPEPEMRAAMDRETDRGADVWLTDPDGVKYLPENRRISTSKLAISSNLPKNGMI